MTQKPRSIDSLIYQARKIQPSPAQVTDITLIMLKAPPTTSVSPEDLAAIIHTWRWLIANGLATQRVGIWTERSIAELVALAFCWGQVACMQGFVLPSLKEAGP